MGKPLKDTDPRVDERRREPRYPVSTRMVAALDGETVVLGNISPHGVAICGSGFEAGRTHLLEIHLDHQHVAIMVEILESTGSPRSHARFTRLPADAKALINQYIAQF